MLLQDIASRRDTNKRIEEIQMLSSWGDNTQSKFNPELIGTTSNMLGRQVPTVS